MKSVNLKFGGPHEVIFGEAKMCTHFIQIHLVKFVHNHHLEACAKGKTLTQIGHYM